MILLFYYQNVDVIINVIRIFNEFHIKVKMYHFNCERDIIIYPPKFFNISI